MRQITDAAPIAWYACAVCDGLHVKAATRHFVHMLMQVVGTRT